MGSLEQSPPHESNDREAFVIDGLKETDLPIVCRWMNDISELHLWTKRRRVAPYAELAEEVKRRCREGLFAVVRSNETDDPIGFVDGKLREPHGVAELEMYIAPEWRMRGGILAVGQMVEHLFVSYPLRKLYCQLFAYNEPIVGVVTGIGFVEEGRFRDFTWWNDRYWDLIVLSLDRAAFRSAVAGGGRVGRLRDLLIRRRKWRAGHAQREE